MFSLLKPISEFYEQTSTEPPNNSNIWIATVVSLLFILSFSLWIFTIAKLTRTSLPTIVRIFCIFFIILSVFTAFPFYLISLILIYTCRNKRIPNAQKKKAS